MCLLSLYHFSMAYTAFIDSTFYTVTYQGADIDSSVFGRLAMRASDEIDKLTFGRIRRAGLSTYDSDTQEKIKLATCAMAEYLGVMDSATDNGVVTTSESISGHSYSIDTNSLVTVKNNAIKTAKSFLMGTGLISAVIQ